MRPVRKAEFFAAIAAPLMRLLFRTLRVRVIDRAGFTAATELRPLFYVFWHNRMLIMPYIFERYVRPRPAAALTSASKDGEFVAAIVRQFGILPVRGSSSRRGGQALVEMRRLVRRNYIVGVTPDGPRGPRAELQSGVVKLAQLTGAPVMPVHVRYSHCWRLKTWDGFMIPRPFSSVEVTFDELQSVAETSDDDAFEKERARLELVLRGASDA